jgi:hypothetical protein
MSEAPERRPVGRPSEYDPAYCERVMELGRQGKSKAQMAAALGCCRNTLDAWAEAHPEFLSAVKLGQELALAWWEDQGQDGITAEKFNATAFIFQMKNRFREDYRDKQDHELTGPNGGPIQHVDLSRLSEEQLDKLETILEAAIPTDGAAA